MDVTLKYLLSAIEARKASLDARVPLPPYTRSSLREKLMLDWIHHCNAIEGSNLSLRETKVVLEGIAVDEKPLREQSEAIHLRAAILYVEKIAADDEALSARQIYDIHSIVLNRVDNRHAGYHQNTGAVNQDASTTPPDFLQLPAQMAELIEWHAQAGAMNPVVRAAELHTRFVKIHPFVDGNGRTGRLILNLELMKFGYPPAVIRKEDRLSYYDALDEACLTGDYKSITALVAQSVQRSLDTYLDVLGLHEGRSTSEPSSD